MNSLVKFGSSKAVSVNLEGVTLTKKSLSVQDENAFHIAGQALLSFDSFSQFWWGDLELIAERKGWKSILESARAELHRSTIHSYVEVARLFVPEDRHPDLSFNHHAAIRYILGEDADVEAAKGWLARAADNKWTVGDLREAMRESTRESGHDAGPMRGIIRLTDFQKISRWTQTVHVNDLPVVEADEIRKCSEPLFRFLCELHRKPFPV